MANVKKAGLNESRDGSKWLGVAKEMEEGGGGEEAKEGGLDTGFLTEPNKR